MRCFRDTRGSVRTTTDSLAICLVSVQSSSLARVLRHGLLRLGACAPAGSPGLSPCGLQSLGWVKASPAFAVHLSRSRQTRRARARSAVNELCGRGHAGCGEKYRGDEKEACRREDRCCSLHAEATHHPEETACQQQPHQQQAALLCHREASSALLPAAAALARGAAAGGASHGLHARVGRPPPSRSTAPLFPIRHFLHSSVVRR